MAKGKGTKDDPPVFDDGGGGGGQGGGEAGPAPQAAKATAKLAARIGELERELASAQRALSAGAIERGIEAALTSSGVIDAETGRVLLAHTLETSPELSVEEALASLKKRKPFLFGSGFGGGLSSGAALAPSDSGESEGEALASLKEAALSSGDRAEVLKYLRARRTG